MHINATAAEVQPGALVREGNYPLETEVLFNNTNRTGPREGIRRSMTARMHDEPLNHFVKVLKHWSVGGASITFVLAMAAL